MWEIPDCYVPTICTEKSTEPLMEAGLVEAVLQAMCQHADDVVVQQLACGCMWNVSDAYGTRRKW